MTILYTARARFDGKGSADKTAWEKYIEFSGLTQLTELVSVDSILNELVVKPDRNNAKDSDHMVTDGGYETGFVNSLDYLLEKVEGKDKFNLLAVVIGPIMGCKAMEIEDFDFVGYDLLDTAFDISALSNCGGFDETFRREELNEFGLIEDFGRAVEIRENLPIDNPDEFHAETNIIAIWRHKFIGW